MKPHLVFANRIMICEIMRFTSVRMTQFREKRVRWVFRVPFASHVHDYRCIFFLSLSLFFSPFFRVAQCRIICVKTFLLFRVHTHASSKRNDVTFIRTCVHLRDACALRIIVSVGMKLSLGIRVQSDFATRNLLFGFVLYSIVFNWRLRFWKRDNRIINKCFCRKSICTAFKIF